MDRTYLSQIMAAVFLNAFMSWGKVYKSREYCKLIDGFQDRKHRDYLRN